MTAVKTGLGSISRMPAVEIETLVARAIRERAGADADGKSVIAVHSPRAVIHPKEIEIRIGNEGEEDSSQAKVIRVRWRKQASKRRREVLLPASGDSVDAR